MDERFDHDHVGVALNGNPTGNISVREGNKTAIVDPGKKNYARRNHMVVKRTPMRSNKNVTSVV